jgi:hypothetical protein
MHAYLASWCKTAAAFCWTSINTGCEHILWFCSHSAPDDTLRAFTGKMQDIPLNLSSVMMNENSLGGCLFVMQDIRIPSL